MRSLAEFSSIFLCRKFIDGRKQIATLAAIVELEFGKNPADESLYVFLNKKRDLLKILYFDRTGFALWVKRLEKSRFSWLSQSTDNELVSIIHPNITLLLQGYDIAKLRPHDSVKISRCI